MKKVKVSEVAGPMLDRLVAKCEGKSTLDAFDLGALTYDQLDTILARTNIEYDSFCTSEDLRDILLGSEEALYLPYSTDWSQGGPIIEREIAKIERFSDALWEATAFTKNAQDFVRNGPTALVAAMRCYVASKLGEEVEVPDELAP